MQSGIDFDNEGRKKIGAESFSFQIMCSLYKLGYQVLWSDMKNNVTILPNNLQQHLTPWGRDTFKEHLTKRQNFRLCSQKVIHVLRKHLRSKTLQIGKLNLEVSYSLAQNVK